MYPLMYHKNLTIEKWQKYTPGQQVLMIANELNRALNFLSTGNLSAVKTCFERAFELTDLTSSTPYWLQKNRELRRFREVLAELYSSSTVQKEELDRTTRALICMHPEASRMMNPAPQMKKENIT